MTPPSLAGWSSAQLAPGVTFLGDGSVTVEEGETEDGLPPVATFWRPLQFERNGEPIAGRMECRAAAQFEPYRAALFELEGVHEAQKAQGRLDGFDLLDTRLENGDVMRRLDLQGRRKSPTRYEVLSYIAVRTGPIMVSIRQTCQFLRGGQVYRQNFFQYVDRYTRFVIDVPAPDNPDPATAPSLDSLTDT